MGPSANHWREKVLSEEKVIKACELDPNFKFEVAEQPGGEAIRACFACGTCTASCPVRRITERYNPRRIIRQVLLGMRDEVLQSDFIWLCSTCYSCAERCPQGVKICDLMHALKNLASQAGFVHPAYKPQSDLIGSLGRLYEIEEFDNKRRDKMGLPPLPTGACEAMQKLFELAGMPDIFKKRAERLEKEGSE